MLILNYSSSPFSIKRVKMSFNSRVLSTLNPFQVCLLLYLSSSPPSRWPSLWQVIFSISLVSLPCPESICSTTIYHRRSYEHIKWKTLFHKVGITRLFLFPFQS